MRQHVHDEAFLDGLAHAVEMEGGRLPGPGSSNTASVLNFGVAVKAKKLMFGCRGRFSISAQQCLFGLL